MVHQLKEGSGNILGFKIVGGITKHSTSTGLKSKPHGNGFKVEELQEGSAGLP